MVMLPHVLFSHIYHHQPHIWNTSIISSEERLRSFWDAVKRTPHPAWVAHPLNDGTRDSTMRAAPLSLHGDEVPVAGLGKVWGRKMLNFSWSSLAGLGSTRNTQFWVWGCFDKTSVKGNTPQNTMQRFFKLLRWSLYWLWRGIWPLTDVDGAENLVSSVVMFLFLFVLALPERTPKYSRIPQKNGKTAFQRT